MLTSDSPEKLFEYMNFSSLERKLINRDGGSGADPGFSFGGGGGGGWGAKDYVRARTLRARIPKSLSAGVQDPLPRLEDPGSSSLGVLCSLVLALFLSILIQNGINKLVDQILGGGGAPVEPPSGSATVED